MGNGKLLVPIYMEALVVTETQEMVDLRPDFSSFPGKILGTSFAPDPLDRKLKIEPGIHLHWALPAELTHGFQRQDKNGGEIDFYRAPNRWFVMRIPSDMEENQELAKAWILESDYLDKKDGTNNWLTQDIQGKFFGAKIGKAFELKTWQEGQHGRESILTAVGPGNPAFAAFYPACKNVFGFHDPLLTRYDPPTRIDSGTFSYLVAGWYSQPEYDPLNPEGNWYGKDPLDPELKNERLEELKSNWQLSQKTDSKLDYPTATICHAILFDVKWESDGEHQSGVLDAYINVAIGNTASEALSALIGARSQNGQNVETLLSAFQYGTLSDPHALPGVIEIDAEIHRRGFHPVKGGTRWAIQKAENQRAYSQSRKDHIKPFPDSEEVKSDFEDLNKSQREFDRLSRKLVSLQWEYYSKWFKSKSPEYQKELKLDKVLEGQINKTVEDINAACNKILEQKQEIEGSEQFTGNNHDYELIEVEKPWFWLPNDPVILLAGPGVEPSDKYSRAESTEGIKCCILDQVLSSMSFDFQDGGVLKPTNDGKYLVDSKVIGQKFPFPQKQMSEPTFPSDEVQALFYEVLFLKPTMAKTIASEAYEQAGYNPENYPHLVEDLTEDIKSVQKYLTRPPRFEIRSWEQAWSPLFMIWEAEWSSTYTKPDQFRLAEHWEFDNTIDYKLSKEKKNQQAQLQTYKGWAPLDPSLPRRLEERLKKVPDLAKRFGEWNLLAQSLSGFGSSLIMREQTLQMPPLTDDQMIDEKVLNLIGGVMDCSPMIGALDAKGFFPIRSGLVRIKNLWIVDAYGQARKVIDDKEKTTPSITVSENFKGLVECSDQWVPLPPRIMQPARLSYHWVSATDQDKETSSDPDTSPVCGWIVPNHFDKSLMVFDCNGKIQGQLQAIENETRVVWWIPGSTNQDENIVLNNPYLQDFITNLKETGIKALKGLLNLIDSISLCITSAGIRQVQSLSVLVGQPLALVRASLTVELDGDPITNPMDNSTSVNSVNFTTMKFPVHIGDIRKGKDGLVGYFNDKDFRYFRPAFGTSLKDADDYFDFKSTIEVGIEQEPEKITLLMDPRAGIHVSSGILPTQFLELPSYVLSEALENMELFFMVGPFIGDPDALRIPLPEDVKGEWSWSYFKDVGSWDTNNEIGKKENRPAVLIKPAQIFEGWLTLRGAMGDKDEKSSKS